MALQSAIPVNFDAFFPRGAFVVGEVEPVVKWSDDGQRQGQDLEGLVLCEVRAAQVVVDDPLNGGTEHWDDRLSPPDLDALVSSLAKEHCDSEWSRTVWRLHSGPREEFRALHRIAQRVEAESGAAVRECIQKVEDASNSRAYALDSGIDGSRETAGRALIRLADEVGVSAVDETEALAAQIGRHSAIVKGLERYRRESRRAGRDRRMGE